VDLRSASTAGGPPVPEGRPGRASDKKPRHAGVPAEISHDRCAGVRCPAENCDSATRERSELNAPPARGWRAGGDVGWAVPTSRCAERIAMHGGWWAQPTLRAGHSIRATAASRRIHGGGGYRSWNSAATGAAAAAIAAAAKPAAAGGTAATGEDAGQDQTKCEDEEPFHAGILSMGRGPPGANADRRRLASGREGKREIRDLGI